MTAVEWLKGMIAKMEAYGWNLPPLMAHIKKAKEMEKQQQGYTEEDMKESWYNGMKSDNGFFGSFNEWFEQFKKK